MERRAIIAQIKQKRELSGIADSIVAEALARRLQRLPIALEELSPSEAKLLVKEVRAELRSLTGQFQQSFREREALLERDDIEELLKTHRSTAERLAAYPKIQQLLQALHITSILDLGCGLNPLALAQQGIVYSAADIREDELALVQRFFEQHRIHGKTFVCDLRTLKQRELPHADLCLLLKVLDLIEQRGHKRAEALLRIIPCRYILASFSTKTLSGKPMRHPQRGWVKRLCTRLGYAWRSFSSADEVFYLIDKSRPG